MEQEYLGIRPLLLFISSSDSITNLAQAKCSAGHLQLALSQISPPALDRTAVQHVDYSHVGRIWD